MIDHAITVGDVLHVWVWSLIFTAACCGVFFLGKHRNWW